MPKSETIHVLDHDVRRRATIARQLTRLGHHAELYDSLRELSGRPPSSGLLLVFDDNSEFLASNAVEVIERTGNFVPVALYSNKISPERIVSAMISGALDYLSWPFEPAAFQQSLHRISQAARAQEERRRKVANARLLVQKLSNREQEVLRALVNGASSKHIGKDLGISPRTVEIHRANLMRKLNAPTTVDAVRIGLYAGEGAWLSGSLGQPS